MMDLSEVYRIIYCGPDDYLRGIILSVDELHGFQFLFENDGLHPEGAREAALDNTGPPERYKNIDNNVDLSSKPLIKYGHHIRLNGPFQASLCRDFGIRFFFMGAFTEYVDFDFEPGKSDTLSESLYKTIRSKDGTRSLMVLFARFNNAVEAHVKVKLSNINSAFLLYGVIAARTSVIKSPKCSSLIFLQEEDDKIEVRPGKEKTITLSRPIVAVPLDSYLVLEFGLFADDGEKIIEEIVKIKTEKDAPTANISTMRCSKCFIDVEIGWRYKESDEDSYRNCGS